MNRTMEGLAVARRGAAFALLGVEGRPVKEYLGIVTGEVIVGANIFRDLFASITDIVGGRSGKYEEVLSRARDEAISEMQQQALQRPGEALLAVQLLNLPGDIAHRGTVRPGR